MKHEYKGTCGHTIVSSPCITPLSIPLCLHKRIPCTVVDSLRKTCRESHNISSKSWITLEFMFYNYSNIQNKFNPQPKKLLSQRGVEYSPKWVVVPCLFPSPLALEDGLSVPAGGCEPDANRGKYSANSEVRASNSRGRSLNVQIKCHCHLKIYYCSMDLLLRAAIICSKNTYNCDMQRL